MIIHYDYRYKALVAEYLLCMRIYTMRDVTFVNGQWFEEVQDDLCCLVIRALWIFKDSPKIESILLSPLIKRASFGVMELLVVIRLTCSMHVSYARRAYMLPTLQQRIEEQSSTNQQRIRIAIQ
jgi:hypothetical protein